MIHPLDESENFSLGRRLNGRQCSAGSRAATYQYLPNSQEVQELLQTLSKEVNAQPIVCKDEDSHRLANFCQPMISDSLGNCRLLRLIKDHQNFVCIL